MGLARIETAAGAVDGTNKTFYVSAPYKVGSVQYFLNGILKVKEWDDGCIEISSLDREVELKEAPLPGDVIQFYFVDTSDATDEENIVVSAATGGLTISDATVLVAQLREASAAAPIRGVVAHSTVAGGVSTTAVSNAVTGTIRTTTTLTATIKDPC